jgi:hypothetical protein
MPNRNNPTYQMMMKYPDEKSCEAMGASRQRAWTMLREVCTDGVAKRSVCDFFGVTR